MGSTASRAKTEAPQQHFYVNEQTTNVQLRGDEATTQCCDHLIAEPAQNVCSSILVEICNQPSCDQETTEPLQKD